RAGRLIEEALEKHFIELFVKPKRLEIPTGLLNNLKEIVTSIKIEDTNRKAWQSPYEMIGNKCRKRRH
ncbi:MAG: hypothetical protein GW914_01010, partial [Candidatus Aenigmarchaeota archaeon]|nr:hypothetical protein [Candidatus Aenigmarchaeota archaeon]